MGTTESIPGGKAAGNVNLIIHFYLVRNLKMSGSAPPFTANDSYGEQFDELCIMSRIMSVMMIMMIIIMMMMMIIIIIIR